MEKKIIIFGGSSGIGFELVKYYLNKKFYVFTTYNKSKRDLLKFKKGYRDKLSAAESVHPSTTTAQASHDSQQTVSKTTSFSTVKNLSLP